MSISALCKIIAIITIVAFFSASLYCFITYYKMSILFAYLCAKSKMFPNYYAMLDAMQLFVVLGVLCLSIFIAILSATVYLSVRSKTKTVVA